MKRNTLFSGFELSDVFHVRIYRKVQNFSKRDFDEKKERKSCRIFNLIFSFLALPFRDFSIVLQLVSNSMVERIFFEKKNRWCGSFRNRETIFPSPTEGQRKRVSRKLKIIETLRSSSMSRKSLQSFFLRVKAMQILETQQCYEFLLNDFEVLTKLISSSNLSD